MAPFSPRSDRIPSETLNEFYEQWVRPGDVFSVLLILGGDVVACALAQLAGCGFTPVTFSFGWVSYSISALVSACGENRLMPRDPDCRCKVINGQSGYAKDNTSWILGRIVRDFDKWAHPSTRAKTQAVIDAKIGLLKKENRYARPRATGLVVSVYQPSTTHSAGRPIRDWVYWSGVVVMVAQFGIAAIPCGLFGDWSTLLITAGGTALAILTGLLPQWRKEKWACRRESNESYILTRGNGAQHAIIVLGNGRGLDLEDLASGPSNVEVSANGTTKLALFILSFLWIVLLITASGATANTWFLLAVGGIGIVQNISIAGWQRRPENFGIPLDFVGVYGETKVMETLFAVENDYPRLGRSMLDEFFPGNLRLDERKRWEELEKRAEAEENEENAEEVEARKVDTETQRCHECAYD